MGTRMTRRIIIDHAVLRCMAWFFVGLVLSLVVSFVHALLWPVVETTTVISPNIVAKRYALRMDSSTLVDWYNQLGGEPAVYVEDYGWPLPAWNTWHLQKNGTWDLIAGIPLRRLRPGNTSPGQPAWALPIVPRPIFAAGSAILYGSAAWGCYTGFVAIRRSRRRRRGLCVNCGYGPWHNGDTCPECGPERSTDPARTG
jgi:hypothetical protein